MRKGECVGKRCERWSAECENMVVIKQEDVRGCNTYPLPKKRTTPNMDEALLSTDVDEEFCDCGLGWCSAVYRGKLTF